MAASDNAITSITPCEQQPQPDHGLLTRNRAVEDGDIRFRQTRRFTWGCQRQQDPPGVEPGRSIDRQQFTSNQNASMGSRPVIPRDVLSNRATQSEGSSVATYSHDGGFNRTTGISRSGGELRRSRNYATTSLPAGSNVYGYNAFKPAAWKQDLPRKAAPASLWRGSTAGRTGESNGQTDYLWFGGDQGCAAPANISVHAEFTGRPPITTRAKAIVWRASNFRLSDRVR